MSTPLENDYYEVREFIEAQKCRVGVGGTPMTHSSSGCPRCRALAALDRIERFTKPTRRETE